MKSFIITIPFTEITVTFMYAHWLDGAEMTMDGYKGVWAWDWPHYFGIGHSFGLLKYRGAHDYVLGVFHTNDHN